MNTQSVSVHKAALNVQANSKSYGEGSSVYLKVLKDNGGGKFTVGFGGNRFLISSELSLKEGDAFLARIKLDGQKVFLVREVEKGLTKPLGQALTALFDSKGNILEGALSSYFEKLGLAPDSFNYYLFQTLKSLSIPFSRNLFRKARLIAGHFPGRELAAGKAFLVLQQKGLDAGIEEVRFFLDGGDSGDESNSAGENFEQGGEFAEKESFESGGEFEEDADFEQDGDSSFDSGGGSDGNSGLESGGKADSDGDSGGDTAEEGNSLDASTETSAQKSDSEATLFKKFFLSLSSLDSVKKAGLLSLFNHSGFGKSLSANGSWIKIPVEYSLPPSSDSSSQSVSKTEEGASSLENQNSQSMTGQDKSKPAAIKGSVFLFLHPQEQKVKKICASVNFFEKNYKFVVLLNNNETRVILNEEFDLSSFKQNFPEWKVSAGSGEEFDFPSGDESLILVDGRV